MEVVVDVGHYFIKCPQCSCHRRLSELSYQWIDFTAHAQCLGPGCDYEGPFKSVRIYPRHPANKVPIRLNRRYIEVRSDETTGEKSYLYRIPPKLRQAIKDGDVETINTVPPVFIEAVKQGKKIEVDPCHLSCITKAA